MNPAGPDQAGYTPRPATISDFAGNGLTTSADFGVVCSFSSVIKPGSNYGCAFPGINPKGPPLVFLRSIGRSVYNALQTRLAAKVPHPLAGLRVLNLQVSYALSRFENSGRSVPVNPIASDQDFGVGSLDNVIPNLYFGPSVLDRTHQFSFGGYADLPGGFQVSIMKSTKAGEIVIKNRAFPSLAIALSDQ